MELGVRPFEARERADVFRRHNVQSLEEILPHWESEERRRADGALCAHTARRTNAPRLQEQEGGDRQEGASWADKGE